MKIAYNFIFIFSATMSQSQSAEITDGNICCASQLVHHHRIISISDITSYNDLPRTTCFFLLLIDIW